MDRVTPTVRSRNMACIRAKDTKPELIVRRYLHQKGLRYRLHVPDLPGKPDLVFVRRRICLFINGCFWHGCTKCTDGKRRPKSNRAYWLPKIRRNKQRDSLHKRRLEQEGWKVVIIWECEITRADQLASLHRVLIEQ